MKITYKELWGLLIDRKMMKKDLLESSKISTVSMAISDFMEFVEDDN